MIRIAPFGMPLGLAHADPIGGPVTGARKARLIHEGLGQANTVAVALLPAESQPAQAQGQHLGGKMFHPYPRQDQKTHVIGDEMQTRALHLLGPTNMTVPRGNLPGSARPAQASHHLAIDEYQLLEMFAHQFGPAQVVVMVQQVVPQFAVRSLRLLDNRRGMLAHRPTQRLMLVQWSLGIGLIRNIALDALAGRQLDQPRFFQTQQQVPRRKLLVAPVRLPPIPPLTQRSCDKAASACIMQGNRRLNVRNVLRSQITGAVAEKDRFHVVPPNKRNLTEKTPLTPAKSFRDLKSHNNSIKAWRFLYKRGFIEGFGHLSARLPGSDQFLITRHSLGPRASADDLLVLDLDGRKIAGKGAVPGEFPIHLEIYRARPDVASVVHYHG